MRLVAYHCCGQDYIFEESEWWCVGSLIFHVFCCARSVITSYHAIISETLPIIFHNEIYLSLSFFLFPSVIMPSHMMLPKYRYRIQFLHPSLISTPSVFPMSLHPLKYISIEAFQHIWHKHPIYFNVEHGISIHLFV